MLFELMFSDVFVCFNIIEVFWYWLCMCVCEETPHQRGGPCGAVRTRVPQNRKKREGGARPPRISPTPGPDQCHVGFVVAPTGTVEGKRFPRGQT